MQMWTSKGPNDDSGEFHHRTPPPLPMCSEKMAHPEKHFRGSQTSLGLSFHPGPDKSRILSLMAS